MLRNLPITNRRMMAKFGFIRRETVEIPLLKVESVLIEQSILERIIGSGSVAVREQELQWRQLDILTNQ